MRSKILLVTVLLSAILALTVVTATTNTTCICQRDGQWGPGHQYQCLADNTYEVCRIDHSGYDHVNICRYVCSSILACDGHSPNSLLSSCNRFGQNYLADMCDASCQLKDGFCSGSLDGCTGSVQCDTKAPGQDGCDSKCKIANFCGDNKLDSGEQCELPGTDDNNNCAQTTQTCQGHKKGVRDAFGDCSGNCLCSNDPFSYECVAGACGAECSVNADCKDGDPNTLDVCSADCLCVQEPVCGNDVINPGEECELPNTPNNTYCSQSRESCLGHKLGTRDSFGSCDSGCGCVEDSFNYQCSKGKCNAQCSANSDCNDGDSSTTDSCSSDCTCTHTKSQVCGNGKIESGEQCELKSTFHNSHCLQSQTECSGKKLGIRNAFGNCADDCTCEQTDFAYVCIKDVCGATCDSNDDCNDNNAKTQDICIDDCTCVHESLPFCGDGKLQEGETCELPDTDNNKDCGQETDTCKDSRYGTRDSFGSCNSNCGCIEDQFNFKCEKGKCDAQCGTNEDCNDNNPQTTDSCSENCACVHTPLPYCGDGKLTSGEQCETPGSDHNKFCGETTEDCQAHRYGTRTAFGDCTADCKCDFPAFEYQCAKDKCGAQCTADSDCNDNEPATMDSCGTDCMCHHDDIPQACGNGIKQFGEQCELPLSTNNHYCHQNTTSCDQHKSAVRDQYGNCNEACQCEKDDFDFKCVMDLCGAECSGDSDCGASACKLDLQDVCDGKKLVDYNNNGVLDKFTLSKTCENSCKDSCLCSTCNPNCVAPIPVTACVKGACGATCSQNQDCEDTNPATVDLCEACTCVHKPKDAVCGDKILEFGEECEAPSTDYNNNCPQQKEDCKYGQFGTRPAFGDCTDECKCDSTDFEYQCVKGKCGAECVSDSDCSANGPHTRGVCLDNCQCGTEPVPFCGDGKINLEGEKCELPSTENNPNCTQTTEDCANGKLGTRDAFGNCNSACGCVETQFDYSCVAGKCGAECSDSADCGTSTCNATFTDVCNGHKLVDYNNNSKSDSVFKYDECENQCTGNCACADCKLDCNAPPKTEKCVKGLCGATCSNNAQCDDGNYRTEDICDEHCGCVHDCITGTHKVVNGLGVEVCMTTEDFEPRVFLCDSRVLLNSNIPFGPGGSGSRIVDRVNNYAFEGEQIVWNVLVFDKNGINKMKDVFMATRQEDCNKTKVQANCKFNGYIDPTKCDARIDEEAITRFDSNTMADFVCTFTVEPQDTMYGQNMLDVYAEDLTGLVGAMAEKENWFFNPTVSLSINNGVDFGTSLRPGTTMYSKTIIVGNDAEKESGLNMNMFISGTDFYDASHSGGLCPSSNQLQLKNFAYYAANGAYSTKTNPTADSEGYDRIAYGTKVSTAKSIFGDKLYPANSPYPVGNILTPGSKMAVTLRLKVPEPCNGNFNDGNIFFWGEPV